MRLDETGTLHAKSSRRWFELERNGAKPNTLRLVTEDEVAMCEQAHSICIHHATDTGAEPFMRRITGCFDVSGVVDFLGDGNALVLICWEA